MWTYMDGRVISMVAQPFREVVALPCRHSNMEVICRGCAETWGTLLLRGFFRSQEGISCAVHLRDEAFDGLLVGKAGVPCIFLLP